MNTSTKILLCYLPFSAAIVSYLGLRNLKRESRLLFEQEASMFKIEKYLGFHNEIKEEDKKWLPGDPYLVPSKNRDISHGANSLSNKDIKSITTEDWVEARLQEHGFQTSIMTGVFVFEICIALILIVIVCFLK